MEDSRHTFIVSNKKIPPKGGTQNIEFSHVNGPKDQAGGCLADLLFCFINILKYYFQKNHTRICFQKNHLDQY